MPTSATTSPRLAARAEQALAGLAPGYFALVMGTGIVSIGLRMAGADGAALALLVLAALAAAVLVLLFLLRWIRHRERMRADAKNPEIAFGYFTIVAAASVVAVGLQQVGLGTASAVLLGVGAAIWIVLGYVLPWQVLMARDGEPILARSPSRSACPGWSPRPPPMRTYWACSRCWPGQWERSCTSGSRCW